MAKSQARITGLRLNRGNMITTSNNVLESYIAPRMQRLASSIRTDMDDYEYVERRRTSWAGWARGVIRTSSALGARREAKYGSLARGFRSMR